MHRDDVYRSASTANCGIPGNTCPSLSTNHLPGVPLQHFSSCAMRPGASPRIHFSRFNNARRPAIHGIGVKAKSALDNHPGWTSIIQITQVWHGATVTVEIFSANTDSAHSAAELDRA